jgi:hypothetical protein
MYKIVHVDKSWIICDGQAKLIAFERRSVARRIAQYAEELLHENEATKRKPTAPPSVEVVQEGRAVPR